MLLDVFLLLHDVIIKICIKLNIFIICINSHLDKVICLLCKIVFDKIKYLL